TPNDGESYFQFPEKAVLNKVDCAGGSFEVKKNDRGEQALIEFNCRAVSANDARVQFQSVVLPFLDHLSFIADLPVAVSSIRIFDKKNDSTVVEYTTPYEAKIVNSHAQ